MRAFVALRTDPHYRRDAFVAGLEALGYAVMFGVSMTPGPRDVLVAWNRYGPVDKAATIFERRGLPVLIAENGYLGNDVAGDRWYAISRSQHNGAGRWPAGDATRWDSLGVQCAPWREGGDEIVVLPQRGIGPDGVAMPIAWAMAAEAQLATMTRRRVRVRPHPGTMPTLSVEEDIAGAWAVVTWGSGAALKALVAGVPVFHAMALWIGAPAARPFWSADIERPLRDDAARLAMLRRMVWAQWRLSEIRSGAAFRALLEMP